MSAFLANLRRSLDSLVHLRQSYVEIPVAHAHGFPPGTTLSVGPAGERVLVVDVLA